MFSRKGKRVTALFLTASALFGFGGCDGANRPDPEPIDGGSTVYTDPDAPKEIQSAELTEFEASFVLFTRYKAGGEDDNTFRFIVAPDESGALTASETVSGLTCPADGDLLDALRDVVVKYKLAGMNGLYDVTAALPPEYAPGGITAKYASGETLTFTTDNDPFALWAEEVCDVFADWFAARGIDGLSPEEETAPLESFSLFLLENGTVTEYRVDREENGDLLLMRYFGEGEGESVPAPADLMKRLAGIAAEAGLGRRYDFSAYNHETNDLSNHELGFYGFGSGGTIPDYSEPDAEGTLLSFALTYASGRYICIETAKASELEGIRPMLDRMIAACEEGFR